MYLYQFTFTYLYNLLKLSLILSTSDISRLIAFLSMALSPPNSSWDTLDPSFPYLANASFFLPQFLSSSRKSYPSCLALHTKRNMHALNSHHSFKSIPLYGYPFICKQYTPINFSKFLINTEVDFATIPGSTV